MTFTEQLCNKRYATVDRSIRESTNFPGDYTLCVCFENKVEHYRIIFQDDKITIDEEEYFDNLSKLVEVSLVMF